MGLYFGFWIWVKEKPADKFEKVEENFRLTAKRIMQQSAYNSPKRTDRDIVNDYKTKKPESQRDLDLSIRYGGSSWRK